jgi:hypothetical protein
MIRTALLAALVGACIIAPALTTGPSEADRAACTPDALRLCAGVIADSGGDHKKVGHCLYDHRARLSAACRAVFDALWRRPRRVAPSARRSSMCRCRSRRSRRRRRR